MMIAMLVFERKGCFSTGVSGFALARARQLLDLVGLHRQGGTLG
jgi:hypothetical protein